MARALASVAFGELRLPAVGPSCPMLAAQCRLENPIAHPYRLPREFNEFLLVDPFQRRVEPHYARRRQPYRLVVPGRSDIRQLLLAANVDRQVGLARVLAHDHAFIDRFARAYEQPSPLLQMENRVSARDAFPIRNHSAVLTRADRPAPWTVSVEDAVHHTQPARF